MRATPEAGRALPALPLLCLRQPAGMVSVAVADFESRARRRKPLALLAAIFSVGIGGGVHLLAFCAECSSGGEAWLSHPIVPALRLPRSKLLPDAQRRARPVSGERVVAHLVKASIAV